MNETDLREIGVNSLGARRKFLSTIEYFQTRSNYYQISEEFMVNTWVSKQDLGDLKGAWNDITKIVGEMCTACKSVHVDQLAKQIQRADHFFKKY